MADSGSESSVCASSEAGKSSEIRFFKTKMCSFNARGKCTRGEACKFAHKPCELAQAPDLYRTKPCMVFARTGRCKDGWNCQYAHSRCDLRTPSMDSCFETSSVERGRAGSHLGSRARSNAGSNTPTSNCSACGSQTPIAAEFYTSDLEPMKVPSDLGPMKVMLSGGSSYVESCPRSGSSSRSGSMHPLQEMGLRLHNETCRTPTKGLSELSLNLDSSSSDNSPATSSRSQYQKAVVPGPTQSGASSASGEPPPVEMAGWFPSYSWYGSLFQSVQQPSLPSVPSNELQEDQQTSLPASSSFAPSEAWSARSGSSGMSSAAASRESSSARGDWQQRGLSLDQLSAELVDLLEDPWEVPSFSDSILAAGLQHPPGLEPPPGLQHPSSTPNAPVAAVRSKRTTGSDSEYWRGLLKPSTIIEIGGPQARSPHTGEQAQILMVNYNEASYKVRLCDGSTKTIKAQFAQPCANPTFFQKLDDIVE